MSLITLNLITVDILKNVRDSFQLRLTFFQAVEGQLKHLLLSPNSSNAQARVFVLTRHVGTIFFF